MNQTRSHSISKKLLALILAMIMVLSLMPMTVFAQEDGEPVQQEELDAAQSAQNGQDTQETGGADTYAATDDSFYRIVHLDCGRKYFSKNWIIALINEMAAAGYNQLQLAFGNGGFRFYLDDLSVGTYESARVRSALEAGNEHYNTYGDDGKGTSNGEWKEYAPETNALTETEMDAIIAHAASKGIDIVPMFNTPGHMHALLAAMEELGMSNVTVSGKVGCLNLSNSAAVAFTKGLLTKYVEYFASKGCSFFQLATDEYSSFNNEFYSYANSLVDIVVNAKMTPRVFNDAFTTNSSIKTDVSYPTQVCYWYQGTSGKSASSIGNSGYPMINTNHDYYYVSTNEYWNLNREGYTFVGDYNESTWIQKAEGFTNTVFYGSNVNSPAGAMFCIWCNTPGLNNETTIAQEIRMILRVIGARMQGNYNYSASGVLVDGGFKADGTINVTQPVEPEKPAIKLGDDTVGAEGITLTMGGSTILSLSGGATAVWTSSKEEVLKLQAVSAARAAGISANAVEVIPVAAGTATITAKLDADGTELTVQATVQEPGTVPITVTVGGTYDVVVKGKDLSGTYTADPAGIVAITAAGKQVTGDPTYDPITALKAGEYYASSEKNAAAPSVELTFESAGNGQYYIKNASGAYVYPDATYSNWNWQWTYSSKESSSKQAVNVKFNGDGSVTVSKESSSTDWWGNTTTTYLVISGSTLGGSSSTSKIYLYEKVQQQAGYQTTISFEGLKPGKATVKIGDVTYIIEVVNEDLTGKYIYINYFITNQRVSGSDGKQSIKLDASVAYGQDGVLLKDLTAPTGTYYDGDNKVTQNVEYYKSEYQVGANIQTHKGWTNKIGTGVRAERVRYYEGSWAVFNGTDWVTIKETTTTDPETYAGKDAVASDGIAAITAYYLQVTDVTQEVTTLVTDWGVKIGSGFNNYSFLDFAVKYESGGARTPSKFANGKTLVYNNSAQNDYVWKGSSSSYGRYIHDIYAQNNSQYEVYMITVTESAALTADSSGSITASSTIEYTTTDDDVTTNNEQVVWVLSQEDLENSNFNDTSKQYEGFIIGGEPIVRNIYAANMHGYLVTYYLRAKPTEDSLTVHYIDISNDSENEFYSYNIDVKSGTFFDSGIGLPETNDLYTENGKAVSSLTNGRVENANGKYQYVSSVLSNLTAIGAQYRYSDYECVRVTYDRADPKNVYLYYTFNNQHTYVVDFGLPLQIRLTDLNANLAHATITKVEVKGAKHGSAVYSNGVLTYTLTEMLSEYERITVTVTGTQTVGTETKVGEVSYQVIIIPASTVYYEDSFVQFKHGAGAAAGAVWQPDGTTTSANQLLEELGKKTNLYGYDNAYNNCTTFSMGSAQKVTVSKDMNDSWKNSPDSAWPTATFTFRGTGFDVISLTDNDSGVVICEVTDSNGAPVYNKFINNYYGYTYKDGAFKETKSGTDNKLYQLPIIKFTSDKWDTYTVTLTPAYGDMFDKTGDQRYSFWLDAIRVYDPLGKDNATYTTGNEKEGYPQFIELHNELVKKADQNTVTCIEGKADADITSYKNYGPNHEIYLAKNQTVAFQLSGDMSKIASVQLGLKAVNGAAIYQIGSESEKTVNTATDMYYDITSTAVEGSTGKLVTIVNKGETILSLTNIKVTFSTEGVVALQTLTAKQQQEAVQAVRALYAAPVEPEPTPDPEPVTFEPSRFEASWGRSVRAGQKATLTVKTSEDVESITVNGETVSTYSTRTERSGWGWWAKKVTYREFTYTVTATATADYTVIAQNGDGAVSQPITATLTVRGGHSWWGSIFDRWF